LCFHNYLIYNQTILSGIWGKTDLAEAEARTVIDELLVSAGWSVQDYRNEDFGASIGVAVREFS
jgi:type I site-specific restriction endonuclease